MKCPHCKNNTAQIEHLEGMEEKIPWVVCSYCGFQCQERDYEKELKKR